jgi:tetratricopeptide (TPR) repeat protein
MADAPNTGPEPIPGGLRPAIGSLSGSALEMPAELPPSKALQWFLLVAFIISGAAYVVNEWTELTSSDVQKHRETKLRRLVQSQSEYLSRTQAGDTAFSLKHYDQAVSEYRLALQAQNNAAGHELLGQALLKQGNPDPAFAQFREALRLDPGLINASSAWALALDAEGKPDEAVKILQDGVTRHPDAGILHYNLATTLLLVQTDAEARRRAAAVADKTQEADAATAEVRSLAAQALSHFTKASRNGISSPTFWCEYGQLLNKLGKYAEAETCLLRATSSDANMASAHFQLALAEVHLGKYAGAIEHYEKVLTLTPDDPATLNNLALLYATATNTDLRSPKMAAQLATRACDATTNQNARYMDTLARCYAADGDFFQAITWEDKAIQRANQLNDTDLARELQTRYALFIDHKTE